MKLINSFVINNLYAIAETSYFKVSLFLTLILSLYGGYLSSGFNYLEGFISVLSFPIFFTFGVLIPFLVITLCTYNYFDKNEYLIVRLGSKKEYLKNLLLTVFIVNSFVYILMLFTVIIALNLFPKVGFGFKFNDALNCHNFIYLIFIIIRLFCIIQSISIFNVLLCKIIDSKVVVGLNMLLFGSFISFSYINTVAINSLFNMPLYIGNYLIISKYGSFSLEFFSTMIFILFLLVVDGVQFVITNKRMGDIKI